MKKLFGFVTFIVVLMAIFFAVYIVNQKYGSGVRAADKKQDIFTAGFARVKITPPAGTPMTGFGDRDWDPKGSRGVHDDLFARALYLSQGERKVIIMGFDLLFFSRDEADRFKGAIGRRLDLSASEILLNTSHTHTGPKVGTWYYTPADPFYLNQLEKAIVQAAEQAKNSAREATLWAGAGTTRVPMSRRLKNDKGAIEFRPSPDGTVCNTLPVVMVKDREGKPISLLFAIACHPSTVKGVDRSYQFSADYPGAAMVKLDAWLGAPASIFLQGAGGDAKASVIGKGQTDWRAGTWDDVDAAGAMAADEVKGVVEKGLVQVEPELRSASIAMDWPLAAPPDRKKLEETIKNPPVNAESSPEIMKLWAREQMAYLDRGWKLPTSVEITLHGVRLGNGLRLVGIEGEAVAELGNIIKNFYQTGVTFPLGYTDGAQMYLPSTPMLSEGGYEVESFWEYRQPAALAGGMERILTDSLGKLRAMGIE
ncbi:MAG: hypothetical protein ACYC9O_05465 [Candidatus Latescibacterota bacterium]